MLRVVFDGGPLDHLLDERVRHTVAEALLIGHFQLVLPATALAEFLAARRSATDAVRTHRALGLFAQIVPVTDAHVWRARELREVVLAQGGPASPSMWDGIVAAVAEDAHVAVSTDATDFLALAAASRQFDFWDFTQFLASL